MKHDNKISPQLYVMGLARQYPSYTLYQDEFEDVVKRLTGAKFTSPGIQKLLDINRNTGILARRTVLNFEKVTEFGMGPQSINELSQTFRRVGVKMAVDACKLALLEANLEASDITHTVAVTCTDTGNPGYDLLVNKELGLDPYVNRALLHGVGCAGGLAALRHAAGEAAGASQRQRPARILVFACELCTLLTHCELRDILENSGNVRIASALFSDAAAALVVCNEFGLNGATNPLFELLDWGNMVLPGTLGCMGMDVDPRGYKFHITKEVPTHAIRAIGTMFERLRPSYGCIDSQGNLADVNPSECDWAIHPGGAAILRGAQSAMNLTEDHLRASWDTYKSYGNSSSPTVLIVLDQLRNMGEGRDKVAAVAFGPGLTVEMLTLRRCRTRTQLRRPRRRLTVIRRLLGRLSTLFY